MASTASIHPQQLKNSDIRRQRFKPRLKSWLLDRARLRQVLLGTFYGVLYKCTVRLVN